MNKILGAFLLCICALVSGCMQGNDDDLHCVPVTNNPSKLPGSSHTAQGLPW
ncbi:MAG: hypothetical protein KR126chlam1_00669 [Chlamydiae bacterium]|nr:hypothetical protein [Chlamydiota bacterium]